MERRGLSIGEALKSSQANIDRMKMSQVWRSLVEVEGNLRMLNQAEQELWLLYGGGYTSPSELHTGASEARKLKEMRGKADLQAKQILAERQKANQRRLTA